MGGKTALIWNPAAGRAKPEKLEEAAAFLSSRGFETESMVTKKRGDAEEFAKEALSRGFDFIVAAGGDGTINEAVQPMAFQSAKLGIIPLGTVNVLAKELGIPASFRKAISCFAESRARTISLGKATIKETGQSRYFLLMAGVGFDAEVVSGNRESLKRRIGRFSYLATAGKLLINSRPEKLRFDIEGEKTTGFHAVIGKASRYGGNFKVTRNASLFDPDLHAVILKSPKKIHLLKLALFSLTGNLPFFEGSEFKVSRSIEVEGRAKVQLDGDCFGETPCLFESAENCLAVIA
ncbi:MAG TPA: diacylglycerol kinase family lipid kinase [Acidobacteriota bacterium]|nr:diacylglycerol kinase family lipid kinase [Acidobacteriota bacterium]HNT16657.1 diacylglycerol kinase family lipid kinase [Acidobacteriota bacterium]